MEKVLTALLSECDTLKDRLSKIRPLPVEALKKIEEALDIQYTYESNRIEGNTRLLIGDWPGVSCLFRVLSRSQSHLRYKITSIH